MMVLLRLEVWVVVTWCQPYLLMVMLVFAVDGVIAVGGVVGCLVSMFPVDGDVGGVVVDGDFGVCCWCWRCLLIAVLSGGGGG